MHMLKPNFVNSIKKVGIFSPSEALGGDRISRMEASLKILADANIEYVFSKNSKTLLYETSAGTIQQRIDDIVELLEDKDVDVLLASWGGKSANQLLPYLPYDLIRDKQKIVAGFSDVAVLLNAITQKTNLITFHGPNVAGKLYESEFGDLHQFRSDFDWNDIDYLSLAKTKIINEGRAQGLIFGGNLNCFVLGLIASNFNLSLFNDGIFFFEDLGLTPRLLEQYLFTLKNRGFFETVSGIVVGQYETSPDNDWMKTTSEDILRRVLNDFEGPIVSSPFTGHSPLPNPAIPIGAMSELIAEQNYHWKLIPGAL